MNISQAVRQLETAVRAYALRDARGLPLIPIEAQRPVYLVGPPGVGKTAAVRQVAERLGVGLASYTMTHHTRQSALGLPQIVRHSFSGREFAVTEYTMSEILLGVYRRVEAGQKRGILFLDEINCVSETLTPALLELLQHKRFGEFAVPEGWTIVCAGNPERYNRSAHAFDPVTLDRLRVIEIEPDLEAWLDYAAERRVRASIRGYLRLRPQELYAADGDSAVTPRSWTDLSAMLDALEAMGEVPDSALYRQYLQCGGIADGFALYEALGRGVSGRLQLDRLLDVGFDGAQTQLLAGAAFDEMLFAAMLLADDMRGRAADFERRRVLADRLQSFASGVALDTSGTRLDVCRAHLQRMERALEVRREVGAVSPQDEADERALFELIRQAIAAAGGSADVDAALAAQAQANAQSVEADRSALVQTLTRGLDFAEAAFMNTHIKVVFLSELSRNGAAERFLRRELGGRLDALRADADPSLRTQRLMAQRENER